MAFVIEATAGALNEIVSAIGDRARFAVSVALTATARDIAAAEVAEIDEKLDRPTPFTRQAYGVDAASRARPTARVYLKPIQSRYLHWQIDGGQRAYKGFELRIGGRVYRAYALPGNGTPLDQFGNVSRAYIGRIIQELSSTGSGSRYFVGTPRGAAGYGPGVYERAGAKLRPVFVFTQSAQYTAALQWQQVAQRTAVARFPANLAEALAKFL